MKPSIPRGTRDFGPAEMQKRNYIFSIIKKNFELFGYQPLETPAMENLTTLMGKYGEEGDKLVFKVQNSAASINCTEEELYKLFGDFNHLLENALSQEVDKPEKVNESGKHYTNAEKLRNNVLEKIKQKLVEKGLRYDLTVPFARYVVMNQGKLTFPLKRYQMQPVWRADKPQKGRYREFYQCDADVIGNDSLINEIELINLIYKVYQELEIPVVIKFNNRKILNGIIETVGLPFEKLYDILSAIDEFEKIGRNEALNQLIEKGIPNDKIDSIKEIFTLLLDNENPSVLIVDRLKEIFLQNKSEIGLKGIDELEYIKNSIGSLYPFNFTYRESLHKDRVSGPVLPTGLEKSKDLNLQFDITLARGLNYYTGTIFEVKANAGTFTPSILGGGRYDDLTGVFGLKNMSGVGISFGVDRIYDVMEELKIFPEHVNKPASAKVIFLNFGKQEAERCLNLAFELRKNNISCEIYPDQTNKITKQFEYAEKKHIPYVCFVKSEHLNQEKYDLKDIRLGEIQNLSIEEIIKKLK